MEQACRYIDAHLNEPLTLSAVSQSVYISRAYLSQMFKEQVGLSFTEYVNARRLVKARRLLLTTDLKIDEIAEACGFFSSTYFSTVFKKEHATHAPHLPAAPLRRSDRHPARLNGRTARTWRKSAGRTAPRSLLCGSPKFRSAKARCTPDLTQKKDTAPPPGPASFFLCRRSHRRAAQHSVILFYARHSSAARRRICSLFAGMRPSPSGPTFKR